MKKKRYFRRGLSLLLALALFLPLAGREMVMESSAVTKAEIDALKDKSGSIASQKKEIQSQLKALQADKSSAMKKKQLLEDQIDLTRQEISNINEQIAMYDKLINEKTVELEQAEADEKAQFELFCRRMRYMEEQGEETSYWAILFSSSSFAELLDSYMMIEEIIQYDNKVVDDLVALQEKVTADRTELEEAQTEQEEAKARQLAVQEELKGQEAEVDKLIAEINAQEDVLEEMEAELTAMVDNGCTVLDVVVEHPLYGEITGQLQLSSRYDVQQFLEKAQCAAPLSSLTKGVHIHNLRCPSEEAFQRVRERLTALEILYDP